ncbi:PAS domain S-box protein [Mucilaginibacter sp.]|uniref:PAS domain S-box protein n=1 Tax=Mucilaginibacter sp. TaxID=1882438 RepID=UPI000CAADE25|nr:PAS domain S-box protein [Mucilaginibacter sp.]PLW90899.1 MAG: hypothetical protein C0154_04015 [Mucilaginibacter sp.]PMP66498.1 MAG: hypothetical protein C0191_00100 [Mucilaginibacter sp.]HEK20503.1 PAS domain S-box protein [Bacteroidota bacterium]
MKKWLFKYEQFVRNLQVHPDPGQESTLAYWKAQLFITLIMYGLPVSFLAAFPGLLYSFFSNDVTLGILEGVTFIGFALISVTTGLRLLARKFLFLAVFYPLAIYLIISMGYTGPGVFYLFGLTVISALILPNYAAWYSIVLNILILFAIAIIFPVHAGMVNNQLHISLGSRIILTANFLFISIITVVLIHRIMDRLEKVLKNEMQLKRRYRLLFEKSPLPMWLFDTETLYFIDVNEAAIRHYGYTRDEFMRLKITDIRPVTEQSKIEEIVKLNRQTGLYHNQHTFHYKRNGELINVSIESNLIEIDGKVLRLVLANDITELKKNELELQQAHQQLRRSEADLRAIFESSVDGLVLIDSNYAIKQFNQKATGYLRINPRSGGFTIGRNILTYIPAVQHADFLSMLDRVKAGETIAYDRHYRTGKSSLWVDYTLNPVYTDDSISGICITGRDITSARNYIQKIEDQNKVFREIAWIQSHIVRAPVARLLGLLQIIQQPTTDEDFDMAVRYMNESVTELDNIVADITTKSYSISMIEKPQNTYEKQREQKS